MNGCKKRKGLDIDALWRKKFKDVENGKSPEKSSEDSAHSEKSEKTLKLELVSEAVEVPKPGKEPKKLETEQKKEEVDDEKPYVSLFSFFFFGVSCMDYKLCVSPKLPAFSGPSSPGCLSVRCLRFPRELARA